jgi:O-antigen ligase
MCALVLGGSSSGGLWANLALQWISGAVLIGLVIRHIPVPVPRTLAIIAAAAAGLVALQLVPLPPALWTMLPQRAGVVEGFALARFPLPWLPLTLDSDASLAVLASMLVPLAGLAVFAASGPRGLRWALAVLVACAAASIVLGLAQQLAGEGTVLQPYAITNPGKATGLFANRNHLATLLVMAIPPAVLLLPGRSRRPMMAAAVTLLFAGAAFVGSKAGIGLALAAAILSIAWIYAPARSGRAAAALLGTLAVLVAAGGASWVLIQDGPLPGGAEQHRPVIIATTLVAARDYFPVGSGAGTFLRVYQHYEDPAAASPEYRNHAHSDYAEVLLEYGAPGGLLVLAVIGWWAAQVLGAWAAGPAAAAQARCGAIMLGIVLAHSLVDYPLRTGALAFVAAGAAILAARRANAREAARLDPVTATALREEHIRITL